MTREDVGEEDREGVATATALAAIRAKDALAANLVGLFGAVAVEKTVAIERLGDAAMGATVLFDEKGVP